jgi:hypothetical protein
VTSISVSEINIIVHLPRFSLIQNYLSFDMHLFIASINSSKPYYHQSNIVVHCSTNLHQNKDLSFIHEGKYHSSRKKFFVRPLKHHLRAHCTTDTTRGIALYEEGGGGEVEQLPVSLCTG